jgi:hypothetical protein
MADLPFFGVFSLPAFLPVGFPQMAAPTDDRVLVIGGYSRARKGQVDKGEHLTDAWALEREDPAAPVCRRYRHTPRWPFRCWIF